jgi:hypothetical protein
MDAAMTIHVYLLRLDDGVAVAGGSFLDSTLSLTDLGGDSEVADDVLARMVASGTAGTVLRRGRAEIAARESRNFSRSP